MSRERIVNTLLKGLLVFVISMVFGCGGGGGDGGSVGSGGSPSQSSDSREADEKAAAARVRDEAFAILQQGYLFPERLPTSDEAFANVDELVRSLGDRFTVHLAAADFSNFLGGVEGRVSGIGVIISQESGSGKFVIVEVLPGSPAARAGVRGGDEIVEVNGEPVTGLALEAVTARIRGPSGTRVLLTLRRAGQLLAITVTREVIVITSVTVTLLDNNIGYVRQTMFTNASSTEMLAALQLLKASPAKGIILDLRGNPGGVVSATLEEADQFIASQRPPGIFTDLLGCTTADLDAVVVRIFGRLGQEQVCVADDLNAFTLQAYALGDRQVDLPVVILVDERTASAAELLTAALRENGPFPNATVIGARTFGKGLIQRIRTLSDGSGLIFVAQEFRTPRGNKIVNIGLTPDIVAVDNPATPADEALEQAKAFLRR